MGQELFDRHRLQSMICRRAVTAEEAGQRLPQGRREGELSVADECTDANPGNRFGHAADQRRQARIDAVTFEEHRFTPMAHGKDSRCRTVGVNPRAKDVAIGCFGRL